MPAPKTLAGYGDVYFKLLQAVDQLNDARPEFHLDLGGTGKATHIRQKFYAFRAVLKREAPQLLTPNAQQVRVTIMGGTLIFQLGESIDVPLEVQLERQGFDMSAPGGGPPSTRGPDITTSPVPIPTIDSTAGATTNGNSAAAVQRKFEEQLRSLGFTGASTKGESNDT